MGPATAKVLGRQEQTTQTPSPRGGTPLNHTNTTSTDSFALDLTRREDGVVPYAAATAAVAAANATTASGGIATTGRLRDNYTLNKYNQASSSDFERSDTADSPGVSLSNERTGSFSRSRLTLTHSQSSNLPPRNYILGEPDDSSSSDHGLVLSSRHTGPLNEISFLEDSAANNQEYQQGNTQRSNSSYYLLQDEYIPGLDYNDIIKKWERESSSELLNGITGTSGSHKRNVPSINNSYGYSKTSHSNLFKKIHKQNDKNPSSLQLSKYSTWESMDDEEEELGGTSGSNDVYGFDSAAKKSGSISISKSTSKTNATAIPAPYDLTDSHAQVEPIPLPSFRTLMTPPSAIEMKRRVSYPSVYNKNIINDNAATPDNVASNNLKGATPQGTTIMDNSLNNLKSSLSPLKMRTQPSSSALTNQLTSLRRNGSISLQRRTSIDEASVSSSYTQLPRDLEELPLAKREEINELIASLPEDFLSQSYSQRKKIVIDLLAPEDEHHYKMIMTLAKKYLLNSSRSSISIMNNSIPNNTGFPTGRDNQTLPSVQITRHNSIASQYLNSFSPVFVMPSSLPNNPHGQGSASVSYQNSVAGTFTRPGGEGSQIFNYTIGKEIGYGAFGNIYECQSNETGESKAAKVVLFKGNSDTEEQAVREVAIWNKLSHPYILPLLKYKHDEGFAMYSLTEKINHGTLYDLVIPWGIFPESNIAHEERCKYTAEIAYQAIEAIKYMHSKNIVHGDIKLENCLLEESKHGKFRWKVYVCDFGMSHDLINDNPNRPGAPRNIGSLPYASPELLTDNRIGFESDAWAFGVMLYVMLMGKFPFKHGSEAKEKELIQSGCFDVDGLTYVDGVSKYAALKEIICGCLEVDPSKRWTITQIDQALTNI